MTKTDGDRLPVDRLKRLYTYTPIAVILLIGVMFFITKNVVFLAALTILPLIQVVIFYLKRRGPSTSELFEEIRGVDGGTSNIQIGDISAGATVYIGGDTLPSLDKVSENELSVDAEANPTLRMTKFGAHWSHGQELWQEAQGVLTRYQQIAMRQATWSFMFFIGSAVVGFGLVGFIAWRASDTRSAGGQLSVAVIGVAAAGVAAYIGKTFQQAYTGSKEQVAEYLSQPLAATRVLTAERLLEYLQEETANPTYDEAVLEIIRAALAPAGPIRGEIPRTMAAAKRTTAKRAPAN